MRKRRGLAEGVEVRYVVQDLPPVVHEQQRRHHVGAHLGEQRMVEDRAEQADSQHGEHDGGNDAPHAPHPEILQADRAAVVVLAQQKPGDEVTREDEEHGDAEQAARRPVHLHMVGDYRQHGEGPQAIERRHVTRPVLHTHRLPPLKA